MIKEAKKLHPKNNFKAESITHLSCEDSSIDLMFAIASFHHLHPEDQLKTLKHWRKKLDIEGVLIMTNWNLFQPRFWKAWLKPGRLKHAGFFGMSIPWNDRLERYYFAFTKWKLSSMLKKAGFKKVHCFYTRGNQKTDILNGENIVSIAFK